MSGAFVKGDPRINRNGRPSSVKSKKDLLWAALEKEGLKIGKTPLGHIAERFFIEDKITVSVLKKFMPDMTITDIEGQIIVNTLPLVEVDGKPLNLKIGENADG